MTKHILPPPRIGRLHVERAIPDIRLALLAVLVAAASVARAQSTPAAATGPNDAENETIVLSPFEVRTEQDTGYLATSVQSGTRLRTDLKDIAASISVVTKDFMDDIAATDLDSLLIYTLGTEVAGPLGNFSDAGLVQNPNGLEVDYDDAFSSALPSTRVRGLTRADVARDFFISSVPLDGYIIQRVEISRGANAMLFGLGSPAGIVNSSLEQARLNKRATEVTLRTDKYGSFRGELDHNEVLIPGKLAFRLNGLFEDESYKVEEAWSKDRRGFAAVTYRPWRDTTFRANFELGNIDSNRPELRPPGDAYTYWWDLGRPVYDPSSGDTNAVTLLGTVSPGWPSPVQANGLANNDIITARMGAISGGSAQMVLVYNDPTSSQMTVGIPGREQIVGFRGGNMANLHPNAAGTQLVTDGVRGIREMNSILNNDIFSGHITQNYWKATQITDPAVYDFYHHMLHGNDKREYADWHTFNLTGEQLFLDGKAGLEVAYNREEFENGAAMPLDSVISGYTLRVDINTHLTDGTPNPNFGRPFVTAYSRHTIQSADRDVGRATGFYDFDLRKTGPDWLGRILGTHRLQASHTRQEASLLRENNFMLNSAPDYSIAVRGSVSSASSANRGAMVVRYLGPDVSGSPTMVTGAVTTPVSQFPTDVRSVNILFYDPPTSNALSAQNEWVTRNFGLLSADLKDPADVRRTNALFTREKVTSSVGILQSHWFERNVVSTVGVRRDHVKTYNAGVPRQAPATGTAILSDWEPQEIANTTQDSVNWGVVVHSPAFIDRHLPFGTEVSVFYNQAENFAPPPASYDIFDTELPHESGETEDYGVMLSLFDGKVVLRAAKYETSSLLSSQLTNLTVPLNNVHDWLDAVQTLNIQGSNAAKPEAEAAWNAWYNSPTGLALRNTFRVVENHHPTNPLLSSVNSNRRSGQVVAPADVVSTGEEYEVVLNPTRNWRIAFNAAKAEAVRTNMAPKLRDLIFVELEPLLQGPAGLMRAAAGNINQTAVRRFTNSVRNQMVTRLSEEGLPTNELRKWRWNLVTNYSFTESFLKGFNAGLGVRWQDPAAIGAPVTEHPLFGVAPDVLHPYHAPEETNYDAWVGYRRKFEHFDWRIQLNVRNIGVGDELIPVSAQPDGSIAGWRIAPSQTWTLRSTFSF